MLYFINNTPESQRTHRITLSDTSATMTSIEAQGARLLEIFSKEQELGWLLNWLDGPETGARDII